MEVHFGSIVDTTDVLLANTVLVKYLLQYIPYFIQFTINQTPRLSIIFKANSVTVSINKNDKTKAQVIVVCQKDKVLSTESLNICHIVSLFLFIIWQYLVISDNDSTKNYKRKK